ncbi:hypothetical protein [Methylobacter sp.]|uniref:phosphatase domain-containing protein n=1 Tax=Methylobacter sp. TaxID=2051955 RepID=UPI00121E14CC|nr:hypothetical protein [Methylobacter sp.]TAK59507.1 MAG: hypothetical protein EPO18_20310 [Methylobacter sp.]
MKDTIVVDLDGTLSDCSARRYLVEGQHRDYEAFHERCDQDPVNEPVATTIAAMIMARFRIVLVSARPSSTNEKTLAWLQKNEIAFHELFLLRGDGSEPDQDLKKQWLEDWEEANGKGRILFVLDDRQKVVDTWRALGLTCFQVASYNEQPKSMVTLARLVLDLVEERDRCGPTWSGAYRELHERVRKVCSRALGLEVKRAPQ